MANAAPPGLYPDPDPRRTGRLRYWTGERWTEPYWRWWRVAVTVVTGPLLVWVLPFALYVCIGGDYAEPPTPAERAADDRAELLCVLVIVVVGVVCAVSLLATHWKSIRTRSSH